MLHLLNNLSSVSSPAVEYLALTYHGFVLAAFRHGSLAWKCHVAVTVDHPAAASVKQVGAVTVNQAIAVLAVAAPH